MKNKWIKIGEVGVDSGGLMITDPCYVKDFDSSYDGSITMPYFQHFKDKSIWYCPCHLSKNSVAMKGSKPFPGSFETPIPEYDNQTPNQLVKKKEFIELISEDFQQEVFPYSYMGYCLASSHHNNFAGQMNAGVCFSSGYGDGCYPVFARYSKDGRIAEVRIKMIDEDGNHPYDDDWDDDIDENS